MPIVWTNHEGKEKPMLNREEVAKIVNEIFREEALFIGGILAVHGMNDDLVWKLIRNLDSIRRKSLRRLYKRCEESGDTGISSIDVRPHPAIQEFLLKIRREGECRERACG